MAMWVLVPPEVVVAANEAVGAANASAKASPSAGISSVRIIRSHRSSAGVALLNTLLSYKQHCRPFAASLLVRKLPIQCLDGPTPLHGWNACEPQDLLAAALDRAAMHYRLERGTIRGSTRLPLGGRAYIPSRDPMRTALAALTCEPSLANLCGVALAAMMKGCRISGLR